MSRKLLLDKACEQSIIEAIQLGGHLDDAAQRGGINRRTLYRWLEKGKQYQADLEKGSEPNKDDLPYYNLMRNVEDTSASVRLRMVGRILVAADDDWKAAAWYLERSQPEQWGRRNQPIEAVVAEQQQSIDTITAEALALVEQVRQQRIGRLLLELEAPKQT
jgi:hypothetical protein